MAQPRTQTDRQADACAQHGTSALVDCVRDALAQAAVTFAKAYGWKTVLGLVLKLVRALVRKQLPSLRELAAGLASLDSVRFAGFLASTNAVYRSMRCALAFADPGPQTVRRALVHRAVAGLCSGLAIALDDPERRGVVAVYAFARAFAVAGAALMRHGLLPEMPLAPYVAFGVSNIAIVYGALLEPEALPRSYYHFIINAAGLPDSTLETVFRARERLLHTGQCTPATLPPLVPCQPVFHTGPCWRDHLVDWVVMSRRSLPTYLPVHWLPLMLFKRQALRKNPRQTLWHTIKATGYSVAFLNTYGFIVKTTVCALRHTLQRDAPWHAGLAGLLTGLAVLFEQRSRAAELAIYCVMRAMQIVHALLARRGYRVTLGLGAGEALMFGAAMAVMLSVPRVDLKPSIASLRAYVFGESFNLDDGVL